MDNIETTTNLQPPPGPPPSDADTPTPQTASRKTPTVPDASSATDGFTNATTKSRTKPLSHLVKSLSKASVKFQLIIPALDKIPAALCKTISPSNKLSVFAYLRHLLQTIITMYREEDPEVYILPWSAASAVKPIDNLDGIPTTPQIFKSYSTGLGKLNWDSKVWFSLHFTYGLDGPGLDNFPSYGTHSWLNLKERCY
jgi:hypothetical protein